jgi:hypothetical protein
MTQSDYVVKQTHKDRYECYDGDKLIYDVHRGPNLIWFVTDRNNDIITSTRYRNDFFEEFKQTGQIERHPMHP